MLVDVLMTLRLGRPAVALLRRLTRLLHRRRYDEWRRG